MVAWWIEGWKEHHHGKYQHHHFFCPLLCTVSDSSCSIVASSFLCFLPASGVILRLIQLLLSRWMWRSWMPVIIAYPGKQTHRTKLVFFPFCPTFLSHCLLLESLGARFTTLFSPRFTSSLLLGMCRYLSNRRTGQKHSFPVIGDEHYL